MTLAINPHRTVCPATRLRCPWPEVCQPLHCAGDRTQKPIAEGDLQKHELYVLRIIEQRAAQHDAIQKGPA